MDNRAVGSTYKLNAVFGSFPISRLLEVVNGSFPTGSCLKLTTPMPERLAQALKTREIEASKVKWTPAWLIPAGEPLAQLAKLAASEGWSSLAVWLEALDRDGRCLLEAEDGNEFLWISGRIGRGIRDVLVNAAGGALETIEETMSLP